MTKREKEVADLAALGQSNKEIGNALSIAEKTVKFHLTKIYRQLGIRGRRELLENSDGVEKNYTCTLCGVNESNYWRGVRAGQPVCSRCYMKRRKANRKAKGEKKTKVRIYDMWNS